ncbi:MAG: 4Fe-4S binding protein [Gammaproteobacteria bacterium]|nr:4Fe-4S binding protein [Gammaproteobacteria bacterium]
MASLRNIAIRWYRRVFGAPAGSDIRDEGLVTVLDGNSAVALSEATISGHAVLGGSFPCADAESVWLGEIEHGNTNVFGEALSSQSAEGPRGIVAAATGLALSGRRATAFLSGPDIAASQDLLTSTAGKHAPLVLHLGTRAAAGHGGALGSGHSAVHLSADSGYFILFAMNVQQAVDFTYIARQVAEESLVPGLVVMDGEQTALAPQDARLLSPAQVDALLGPARQEIESPTAAQELLFGERRRRVPAWHDLDEPVLTGALFDANSFALGSFARRPYFDAFVAQSLLQSLEQFASVTGRLHEPISRYRLENADTVLLAQGSAIEIARAAADCLRTQHHARVGVVGIHALRPFPVASIVDALHGRNQVFVLERVDTPLSGEPPLTREVRAGLNSMGDGRRADCHPVVYGVGGLPLQVADLIELCTGVHTHSSTPLFLGLAFDDRSGEQPKRAVLLDALRRAYPDAARMGIRAGRDAPTPRHQHSLTISIRRIIGQGGEGILGAAAALLHRLEGGRIRTRPSVRWESGSAAGIDWLTHGDDTFQDPGDGLVADVMLDVPSGRLLLRESAMSFGIPLVAGFDAISETSRETLLGGLFGALTAADLIDADNRRILAARQGLLDGIDAMRSEAMITAFRSGLEQVVEVAVDDDVGAVSADRWEGEVPATVRHLGRNDDHYASLPRFWDQLGVMYRDGMSDRLTAGPYLATGTMPPLSSTFSDLSRFHDMLPVFDPTVCTGCGLCWTHCPDSAIGVTSLHPAGLIDAGINSTGAEAVRQVSGKLSSRIIANNKSAQNVAPTFGEMLDDAHQWLEDRMPLPDDRKLAIRNGIASITAQLGKLPVAVTKPFFQDAESRKKDSAELLSLAINPDACKACGICISSCEPEALRPRKQDAASLTEARELWSTWTATPDTASETLERAASNPDIGTMSALLLSRYCQFALAGGDHAEAGSGEKMAVRMLLAVTEFHRQPLHQRFAQTLHEAGEAVSALLKETLSGALTVEDLDAVTAKLHRTKSPRVDLKTLAEEATSADHSIDTEYLLRLIHLSNRISSSHGRLVRGEHGLGRARYGLAVAGGSVAAWAGAFPHNPFQAPVLIDMSGDAAQLAAGLIEGHLEETTELVRLLRLARLEIDHPDGMEWKRESLLGLRWPDLSDDEYKLCPPLLLIGSDEMLAGQGLGQLVWLLNSRLPVKVLVMNSLDFGIASDPVAETAQAPSNNPRASLSLLALAQRNAFVVQTSIADRAHFGESILQALRHDGPALIQVYAPSPTRHGLAVDRSLQTAEIAVASRAMPLFRYDPAADGVFGSRISLEGNPHVDEAMATDARRGRSLTAADWAFGQQRFRSHFQPLASDAATPIALHEWLQLDTKDRLKKTPYLAIDSGDDERRLSMTPAMLELAKQCLEGWRTLQELAGVVTPFTERLEQEIRSTVAAEHQAELNAQSEASEKQINQIKEEIEAEIARKIRGRLTALASRKRGGQG